jgi:hypothetical protein
LRAHLDTVVAVLLTAAYLVEVNLAEESVIGDSFVSTLELDEAIALAAGAVFLLSLAIRTTFPLLPLALAFVALTLLGRGSLDGITTLTVGVVLAAYSVGAWSGGRTGQVGALGVGVLVGLAIIRASGGTLEPRDVAAPVLFIIGG